MKRFHSPTTGLLALVALAAATTAFVATHAVSKEAEAKAKANITYSGQVVRILQDNCQTCHHAGTAAPFALMNYSDAVKQAENIKDAISDKRMPPWYADPHFGKFANDRRLKPADIDALLTWIDTGMKEGDPKDLPPPPKFTEGWQLGKPDVILQAAKPFALPAGGTDDIVARLVAAY